MEHTCVVGLGWGDEGKGKIVDMLCPAFDVVVRYNGGANAGHTVRAGGEAFALHLLPTGVLHRNTVGVIGPGVVVDPIALLAETDALIARGIPAGDRLRISDRAHLVMPYHLLEDRLSESNLDGSNRIGTTARGIGPCYADKMRRTTAVRMIDLVELDRLKPALTRIVGQKRRVLEAAYGAAEELDAERLFEGLRSVADRLAPLVCDTSLFLESEMASGRKLLFEGANGMLLDIDHGTYPYVTSSQTGPQGVASGAGVSPWIVQRRIGVTKAYSTRVGEGPFPTELTDATGERIREQGHEYGTTTGRPRRCGWLDAVAIRRSVRLGGISEIALTHLDTLSGFERVGIAVGYRLEGRLIDTMPADPEVLARVEPELETLAGWEGDIRGVKQIADLPSGAQSFIARIEELMEIPVEIVSVGADRQQTVFRTRHWRDLIRTRAHT